ncbi:MAG: hypothetical protein C0504_17380 [Candidatus Solibacter sp.]|nr:hypothetical protein [Candidatus Solibacter sp.]
MAVYRIHRMKDHVRHSFRFAPHTSGVMMIKPRDFEPAGEVTAANVYDAWMNLRGAEQALDIGDVLETGDGSLCVCKYVGFEEARWVLPEMKAGKDTPAAAGSSVAN